MTTPETELLPCPFCGKIPFIEHEGGCNKAGDYDEHFYIKCCITEIYGWNEAVVIKKWNTRPTAPQNAEALGFLNILSALVGEGDELGQKALSAIRAALQPPTAPAQAEEVEKMAKALRMVVHNAAIQRGKEGKAWDGDFVIKQCQSALTEYLAAQDGRCPDCGYTEEDKKLHGDHHLCRRADLPKEVELEPLKLVSTEYNAGECISYEEGWNDCIDNLVALGVIKDINVKPAENKGE